MKVGIVGVGMVGGSLKTFLETKTDHELSLYDPAKGYKDSVDKCDVVFICVPVDNKSFKQDKRHIHDALFQCSPSSRIFIRSTVVPHTCDKLRIEYNMKINFMAEFLTERRAEEDMNNMDILVGLGKDDDPDEIRELVQQVFNYTKKVKTLDNSALELGKLVHNCFGAMKVTYFNSISSLCDRENIDYGQVLDSALFTGYINKEHTQVPGPDGLKGYGGKCFPNNVVALMGFVNNHPSQMLLNTVHCLNNWFRGLKNDLNRGLPTSTHGEQNVHGESPQFKTQNTVKGIPEVQERSITVGSTTNQPTKTIVQDSTNELERQSDKGSHISMR